MNLRIRQRSSGVALIIVMVAVVALSILAGLFAYSMKVEGRLAMNSNNDTELEWMGRSGAEVAKCVLGLQMGVASEPYDALNQVWAGGPGGMGMSNSPLAGFSMKDIPLGNGTISVDKITDLESRANINMANEAMLQQALILMGVDAGAYPSIINSILDWIDQDNVTRVDGAESDYYQGNDPPYVAKNGPIDTLPELLMIRGMTPDLYWGPSSTNYTASRMEQKDPRTRLGLNVKTSVYAVGFADLFTPVSSGRININTASAAVLQLIPGIDERVAGEIIKLRAGQDGVDGTDDDVPLRNPGELVNANLPAAAVQQAMQYCDVRSRTFEAHISATIGGYTRHFVAVIVRNNPRDLQVISFHSVE
jgi:general secretion pathway protein K